MASGRQIALPGFKLDASKRVQRDARRLNVSARLKARDKRTWRPAARDWQRPLDRR
jgi:hypothetical protein